MTFRTVFFPSLLAVSLLLVLSGCSPQPARPAIDDSQQLAADRNQQIQQLLTEYPDSQSPRREAIILQASDLLLLQQQPKMAEQLLTQLQADGMASTQYSRHSELICRLQLQRGQHLEALATLEDPRLMSLQPSLEVEQQLRINGLRARVLALLGSHIASAQQRIYSDPLLSGEPQLENRRAIWHSLMYVPAEQLQHYEQNRFSDDYRGWLQLALIAKSPAAELDRQVEQLDDWQQRWPLHPANSELPEDLALIRELADNQPQRVTLMLPLSGKLAPFGQAVRDGFMAAFYRARANGASSVELTVVDSASGDFIEQYHRVAASGTELIIGPLDKQRLQQLFDEDITVPTLALNRIDDYGMPPAQLFQFSLAPQDEARQLADIAFLENHRQALILAPEGDWGQRVADAFNQRWQQLGGETSELAQFGDQASYSKVIADSLLLTQSHSRAQRMRQLMGEHIEFLPRRRQDIDMIFLLAKPQQARSIKPLLDYHYAGELPIYATSRSYGGHADRKRNSDLNGIKFTDLPWILQPASPLKQQIDRQQKHSRPYQRMYALGVDSYQLYPRLRQLQQIPSSRVYGQTGSLSLNGDNAIERRVLLAQIKRGEAVLTPLVDQSLGQALIEQRLRLEAENNAAGEQLPPVTLDRDGLDGENPTTTEDAVATPVSPTAR